MDKSAAIVESNAESNAPELISEENVKERERSKLAQEEAAVESKIVELIIQRNWESLKPNTGVSVEIRGSYVCVDYHEELGYRVWEWHGHCMIYEEGEGYNPEYMYGNYFEPLVEEDVGRPVGLGLSPFNRRITPPGLGGVLSALEKHGTFTAKTPTRNIFGDTFRRIGGGK